MTWLTWRQFRLQAYAMFGLIALLLASLVATGGHLRSQFAASGLSRCGDVNACGRAQHLFAGGVNAYPPATALYFAGIVAMYVVPVLIGMFWGSPMVARELEARTLRVTWSQGVTRTRWITVKLALVGAVAVFSVTLLSSAVTWWADPIDRASATAAHDQGLTLPNHFTPLVFGARGVVPVGYALFAFVAGVAAGLMTGRTLAAMAVIAALLAGVALSIPLIARPHYAKAAHLAVELQLTPATPLTIRLDNGRLRVSTPAEIPGAWVLSAVTSNASGRTDVAAPAVCMSATASLADCDTAINKLHLRQEVTYQPASRFWPFQLIEAAIYLVLAALIAVFCLRRASTIDLT